MKNLKLLSKKLLLITIVLFTSINSYSSDKPVDIWNVNEEKKDQNSETSLQIDENNNSFSEMSIYKKDTKNKTFSITQDTSLNSKKIKIAGLYDPQDYDLDINM